MKTRLKLVLYSCVIFTFCLFGNITAKAEEINTDTYTITFETGSFMGYEPIKAKKGEPLTNLPVPELEGDAYFSGWVSYNGESVENGYIPTSDMTLYMTALCPAVSLAHPNNNEENKKKVDEIKGFNVSVESKKATLTWKAAYNANKYQLQVAKNKKMNKNLKKYNVTKTKKVLKLKKGTYYARVRAINGKVCNSWTKVKKIKIKK